MDQGWVCGILWEDGRVAVFQLAGRLLLPIVVGRFSGLWLVNCGRLSGAGSQGRGDRRELNTDTLSFNASLLFKGSGLCMPSGPNRAGAFLKHPGVDKG